MTEDKLNWNKTHSTPTVVVILSGQTSLDYSKLIQNKLLFIGINFYNRTTRRIHQWVPTHQANPSVGPLHKANPSVGPPAGHINFWPTSNPPSQPLAPEITSTLHQITSYHLSCYMTKVTASALHKNTSYHPSRYMTKLTVSTLHQITLYHPSRCMTQLTLSTLH